MTRNDLERTTKNQNAVGDFVEFWKRKKASRITPASTLEFIARVRYRWRVNDVKGRAKVYIVLTGHEPFRIELRRAALFRPIGRTLVFSASSDV
jgi:hypothetical protein